MSRLNGIDVSGWNKGIDTARVSADFVIVKATEGIQGTVYNPAYRQMADDALKSGKLLGFYHYANGGDPIAEADSFYAAVSAYRGRALLCLDWEKKGNRTFGKASSVAWCKAFLDRLRAVSGSTPVIYMDKGTCNAHDWSSVARDYPLWGAEYAYDDYTYQGYESDPWQSKARWGAWGDRVLMHQYGYVNPRPHNGGVSKLDGEVFYGDRATWERMCGMAKGKLIDLANEAAEIHHYMCTDPRFGYSQAPVRWGGDHAAGTITFTTSTGRKYRLKTGSYDCSSSVITAWRLALQGTPYEGKLVLAGYTGDMVRAFVGSGLFTASLTAARRGDLYVAEGKHTAMCQDGGSDGVFNRDLLSEFNRNERHTATYGQPGDQDGFESVVRDYYNDGWNTVLHYNHKADIREAKVKIPKGDAGTIYRMYGGDSDHLLTADHNEAQTLADNGWTYEGVAWVAPAKGADVWRLYKGEHLLTASKAERDALRKAGWRYEGVACKSGGKVKVYRLYDPRAGRHLLTKNATERKALLRAGWRDEGVALHAQR